MQYIIAAHKDHFNDFKREVARKSGPRVANALVWVANEADMRLNTKHPIVLVGPFWRNPSWERVYLPIIISRSLDLMVAIQWFPHSRGAAAVMLTRKRLNGE